MCPSWNCTKSSAMTCFPGRSEGTPSLRYEKILTRGLYCQVRINTHTTHTTIRMKIMKKNTSRWMSVKGFKMQQ